MTATPRPANIAEMLTHALALEIEANERYADLADQMKSHNNPRIAKLFAKMANIEKLHVNHIRKMIDVYGVKLVDTASYYWTSPEGPETTDPLDLHYLITPRQALELARHNEARAREYYAHIAESAQDEETRRISSELATEEEEHVALIESWLAKVPETDADWDHDDDPPFLQD
ncbi:MAG TPA: ferritin family protein [Gammaproteobacteria bacterium]|nr:ferritin family protein [Gammaproteobacteria bacterium]